MTRWFNTAGPCLPGYHYMIPAIERLPEARGLLDQMGYFVVHAPRQTGKTTSLMALARELTAEGRFAALHFSCEEGGSVGDDYGAAQRALLGAMFRSAELALPPELRPPPVALEGDEGLLSTVLSAWSRACPRPLVLIFDEIDALLGASLVNVLRQLRAGYSARPGDFPWSVILCGLRDVRDYKAASGGEPTRLGSSSPFNIKLASLRLGDFTPEEIRALYAQHTADTGQAFTEEAIAAAAHVTGGQPWLVNALAHEIVDRMSVPREEPITAAHVDRAKERLILARQTHLDSLVHKLREPRVRSVIEPMLAGSVKVTDDIYNDDVAYVRDLGLIAGDRPLRIANPIYREVIVRVLGDSMEERVTAEPARFVLADGRLAFRKMLRAFAAFWREHGEVLVSGVPYSEVAPQIVLMAFMQRVVNGGGYIDREYGIGRGRIDLLIRYPYRKADGTQAVQRRALEIKVWRAGQANPLKKGLEQLDDHLARLGLSRGTLVIFDARGKVARKAARFEEMRARSGRRVRVMWL